MNALISVHDVMPETLGDVIAIVRALEARGLAPVTLLVVPGRDWTPLDVEHLHDWQKAGHQLAGHGWRHRAGHPLSLRHRLHAAFISRTCGEHLSLAGSDILALMRRNHRWFAEQGLDTPELYVPPAWALGRVGRNALGDQPFAQVETLAGIYDVASARLRRLPLLGFEADTCVRAAGLRLCNGVLGRGKASPRVAIHPTDPRLRLRADLDRTLDRITATQTYSHWSRTVAP